MRELVLKKCNKCGSLIKVLKDCNCKDCGIICCNETMKEVKANSTDAAFEKHVPTYEVVDNKLLVTVNHVMEDDYFIEWVCFLTDSSEEYVYFKPGEKAQACFENKKGILYSYCNKHSLWMTEVK